MYLERFLCDFFVVLFITHCFNRQANIAFLKCYILFYFWAVYFWVDNFHLFQAKINYISG